MSGHTHTHKLLYMCCQIVFSKLSPKSIRRKLDELVRCTSPQSNNLDVPKQAHIHNNHMEHSTSDTNISVNIAVPSTKRNVVAPWEDSSDT